MEHQQIDYAGPETRTATRRSAGQWMILLIVWLIGLVVWTIYLAALGYLLIRIL